jgi:ribosomal protein S18 acetylase RimI-like enzyme
MTDAENMSVGSLVPALDFPAETLRLASEQRDQLRSEGKIWADFYFNYVRRKVADRSLLGLLWSGPGDEAIALAMWELSGGLGRRGSIYLAAGYQRRAVLETFLQRLGAESPPASPMLSWADEVSGISDAERTAVFAAMGFSPVVRADMRYPKGLEPPRLRPIPGFAPRTLSLEDEPLLADLLRRVYSGSPERALFATSLDENEDARKGIHDLLHGEIGTWLPKASFGIEKDGRLIAQTMANDLEGGLITEVGVDPGFRGRGLARRLLPLTIDALRLAGFEVPRLVVTMWNSQAVRLYQSLGFEFVPGGAGRVWLNLPLLGIQLPPSRLPD